MIRVDTSSWREFALGGEEGLFEIVKGSRLTRAEMKPGNINYIGATAVNNGVTSKISNSENLHPGNVITVSYNGSVGEAFYQADVFWASDDVNVLYPKFSMNANIAMFLIPLIRRVGSKYKFVDKWKLDAMCADRVPLPVTRDGEPDWDYMEAYAGKTVETVSDYLGKLGQSRSGRHVIDSSQWAKFPIGGEGGLFRIEKGTRLTRANMVEGDIPFIGASTANNGVTSFIGNTEYVHPGNVITVAYNGQKATGKAFYQPKPFWASDDVHVLYPNFDLNELRAMFLLPIFRIVGEPYAFEDKWKIEYMEKDELPLPIDAEGAPDWDYMESFMAGMLESSSQCVSELMSAL